LRFLSETGSAVRWVLRVLAQFMSNKPVVTVVFAFCVIAGQIATLLAFFLPLKILILAGSEGVPRYFRFMIEPDEKTEWIVILSIGAVVIYVVSLLLDRLGQIMSSNASTSILAGANEVAVTTQLREDAKGFYVQFVRIFSDVAVFVLGLVIIGLIYWPLAAVVFGLVLAEFVGVAAVVGQGRRDDPGRLYQWISQSTGEMLNVLFSVNFLVAFFVLLGVFLFGSGMNILLAILTVLILRQSMKGIVSIPLAMRALWLTRPRIDPLVFRNAREQVKDRPVGREFREVFRRRDREYRVEGALAGAQIALSDGGSRYVDVAEKNVFLFQLWGQKEEQDWFGLQRVFSGDRSNLLEHEDYLFDFVDRESLLAPPVVARYKEMSFHCQIVEVGPHEEGPDWDDSVEQMVGDLWSLEPPAELVSAYHTSHATLEGRLTEDFLLRLDLAADNDRRRLILDQLVNQIKLLRGLIATVPLHICNPDINPRHVARDYNGKVSVWSWQRWSIDHLGVVMPPRLEEDAVARVLSRVSKARELPGGSLTRDHLSLANAARSLEKSIHSEQFNSAFMAVDRVVNNPLMKSS
jgi:hypothetical protein